MAELKLQLDVKSAVFCHNRRSATSLDRTIKNSFYNTIYIAEVKKLVVGIGLVCIKVAHWILIMIKIGTVDILWYLMHAVIKYRNYVILFAFHSLTWNWFFLWQLTMVIKKASDHITSCSDPVERDAVETLLSMGSIQMAKTDSLSSTPTHSTTASECSTPPLSPVSLSGDLEDSNGSYTHVDVHLRHESKLARVSIFKNTSILLQLHVGGLAAWGL